MKARILGLLALGLLAGPIAANAGAIIDFTDGRMESVINNATYGYSFSLADSVTVVGLGVIESFGRPFAQAHDVGVWNANGVLLASASVSQANTAVASTSALGQWRVASIADILLGPGTYFAGVFYNLGFAGLD